MSINPEAQPPDHPPPPGPGTVSLRPRPVSTGLVLGLVGAGLVCLCLVGLAGVVVASILRADGRPATDDNATRDLTITSCGTDPVRGAFSATLDIVNRSARASSYVIVVAFETVDGKTRLDQALSGASSLQPGQTSKVQVLGFDKPAPGAGFDCKVVSATRIPDA